MISKVVTEQGGSVIVRCLHFPFRDIAEAVCALGKSSKQCIFFIIYANAPVEIDMHPTRKRLFVNCFQRSRGYWKLFVR